MMSHDLRQRAERVFHTLADLPFHEREKWLEQHAGDDADVLREVRGLLAALDGEMGDFMDRPAFNREANGVHPKSVGAYQIVGKLGEGGMGIVYEARQENPRRTVALKLIRPGVISSQLFRRFEHEAQILGQLQHSGIAHILEAGTADVRYGDTADSAAPPIRQSFFAMEYVRGAPLTRYAEEKKLSIRDRLSLFIKVCDAVQYAHTRGVIHRDIKPGNILVDELGQPKILDFGVARATDSDLKTTTLNTAVGQLIGTLPYMSPEQVSAEHTQIDPRTDVYALGVTLYELLAGRLPFDLRDRSIPDAARIIREDEPTRLSSIDPRLRGDVETIVAKAIEKDRNRRYRSVAELIGDIERFLCDEPVHARPASAWYQLKKFSRRNRGLVAGLGLTMLVLLVGIVATSTIAIYAFKQRDISERRNREALRQTYRASIAAAQAALQTGDLRQVETNLEAAPAELRGWEWRHLRWLAKGDSIVAAETVDPDCLIAISGDEKTVVTRDSNGQLRHWALPTLSLIKSARIDSSAVRSMVLDETGRRLFVESAAGEGIVLYDLIADRELWRNEDAIGQGAFAERASAVVAFDRTAAQLLILDIHTGHVLRTIPYADGRSEGMIEVSPDGRLIHTQIGPTHRLLNFQTGDVVGKWTYWLFALNQTWDKCAYFEPVSGNLCIRSVDGDRPLRNEPLARGAHHLHWLPGDAGILVADASGIASVVDHSLREVETVILGRDLSRMRFLSDPRTYLRIRTDRRIEFQRTPAGRTVFMLAHPMRFVGVTADISPDGRMVVVGDWGYVRAYDAKTADLKWCRLLKRRFISAVAISPDGKSVSAVDRQGWLWVLAVQDGTVTAGPHPLNVQVTSLAWLDRRDSLAVGTADGQIKVLAIQPHFSVKFQTQAHEGPVIAIVANPDGQSFITARGGALKSMDESTATVVKVWNARTFQSRELTTVNTPAQAIACDPNGGNLAVATTDGTIRVIDPVKDTTLATLTGLRECTALAVDPAIKRLVAYEEDAVARVFDLDQQEEVLALPSERVFAARFSSDGSSLIASGPAAAVMSFDTKMGDAEIARRFVSRSAVLQLVERRFDRADQIIRSLAEEGELASAVRDAAISLVEKTSDHVGWLISDAIMLLENRVSHAEELPRAVWCARRATELLTEDANAAMVHAEALYRNAQFDGALTQIRRVIELRESQGEQASTEDQAFVAMCLNQTGAHAEALATFRRASERAGSNVKADEQPYLSEAINLFVHDSAAQSERPR